MHHPDLQYFSLANQLNTIVPFFDWVSFWEHHEQDDMNDVFQVPSLTGTNAEECEVLSALNEGTFAYLKPSFSGQIALSNGILAAYPWPPPGLGTVFDQLAA